MKARNSAKARWTARASVALMMAKFSMKGSGEAIHSWNSDQHRATPRISLPTKPGGVRAPVSDEATSSSSSS